MANQVYETTHEGLSGVMSPKAATHVLRKALDTQGFSSKSITGSEMRDVLMGPVYQELTSIMPKEGVERTLKQIIKNLKKQAKAARNASEETPDSPSAIAPEIPETPIVAEATPEAFTNNAAPVIAANVLLFEEETSGSLNAAEAPDIIEDLNAAEVQNIPEDLNFEEVSFEAHEVAPERIPSPLLEPLPVQKISPLPQSPALNPRVYTQEELGSFLMRFAQVENIKIVAIVQSNGIIKQSRGSGFDLAAISRIGSMGLKLLSRGRRIHSFYLSHQKGQLFLFPLADHTLIIVGNNEVNVGEVFTTLSTLEEHL